MTTKKDETTVTVRVPTVLFDSIKKLAESDSCSVSSVVRRACLKYIAERARTQTPTIKTIPIDGE